jgi:hypothetical protein
MSAPFPIPPSGILVINPITGGMDTQWQNYFNQLAIAITTSGAAPADGQYWVSENDLQLPDNVDMSSKGAGYLKQAIVAGRAVPSTTTTIPITDINGYQTGSWVPVDASGASLALTVTSASFVRVGDAINVQADLTYPVTVDGSNSQIGGLPFTSIAAQFALACASNLGSAFDTLVNASAATVNFSSVSGVRLTNAALSTVRLQFAGVYFA